MRRPPSDPLDRAWGNLSLHQGEEGYPVSWGLLPHSQANTEGREPLPRPGGARLPPRDPELQLGLNQKPLSEEEEEIAL